MRVVVLGGRGPASPALERQLRELGAPPQWSSDAPPASEPLEQVFIDATVGGVDARALCAELATRTPAPAIFVIAPAGDLSTIEWLVELGATEWVTWPIGEEEFALRVRTFVSRARRLLRNREERDTFRVLFREGADPVSVIDLSTGLFVDVNDAWTRQYGYSRPEVVGKMGPRNVSAEPSATQTAMARVQQAGSCRDLRWHRNRAGEVFPVEIHAATSMLGGRKVLVAMIRDLSERVRLETQLRQADRLASVGTLAAGVAHEINNPLAFVVTNLDYLQNALERHSHRTAGQPLDLPSMRDAVAEARDGVRRVREIVRDLKTFSAAEVPTAAPVDVANVAEVSLRLVANELRHRATLVRDFRPAARANVNEGRLGQVLVNLLSNAIHALPDRPRELNRIELCIRDGAEGTVVVEVKDNGTGIAQDDLARIFDPFFTTRAVGEGMGLGLSICHSLVQGMGGRIEVESLSGRGSTFRVVVPAAEQQPIPRTAAASVPAQKAPAPRVKLLLIDDERNLGLVLGRALEEELDLDFVTDGRDGLRKIADGERFDAVVCDLMMPSMTGMEFYEELRRVNAGLADRTGFITGGTFTPPARDFASRMSDRIIEKPFMAEDLQALVRTLMK